MPYVDDYIERKKCVHFDSISNLKKVYMFRTMQKKNFIDLPTISNLITSIHLQAISQAQMFKDLKYAEVIPSEHLLIFYAYLAKIWGPQNTTLCYF